MRRRFFRTGLVAGGRTLDGFVATMLSIHEEFSVSWCLCVRKEFNEDRWFHASKSLTTVAPVTSGSVSRSGRPLWR